jgi:metallo-beta-lactamase family protein
MTPPRITFLGATDTVTGSRYLVEHEGIRLLVDCGLFQGPKKLRQRNWEAPSVDPASLAAVVLTHAHLDHTGYVPKLCKLGFRGRIYCTEGTRDLLRILLPDSGHLQEEEARSANRHGYSHHKPALPLYTRADAEAALEQLVPVGFGESFSPARGVTASFTRAGHIVGSGCLRLELGDTSVTFTGDVGRPNDPVMKPADPLRPTDYLVVESTYGDRRHPESNALDDVARVVNETLVERRGTLVVPAFAVGRAQHLLYLLAELKAKKRIPPVKVYLDSPMATDATHLFCHHKIDHRISDAACTLMCKLPEYTHTADESKAIDRDGAPSVIISASGMATGGRVLHHLRRFLPDQRSAVLLVGYQAAGTRGRLLAEGTDELNIMGQYVQVKAKIVQIEALSAHADYREMMDWLRASAITPKHVFVTHGEPQAADALRRRLGDELQWEATVPSLDDVGVLE